MIATSSAKISSIGVADSVKLEFPQLKWSFKLANWISWPFDRSLNIKCSSRVYVIKVYSSVIMDYIQ